MTKRTRKKATATTPNYPGPTLTEVEALTDKQVENALTKLGLKSEPLPWHEDDPGRNVARFAVDNDINEPKVDWSEKDLAELKAGAVAWHTRCERVRLFTAHIGAWVNSLSDERLWDILENITEEKASVAERRYTDRDALRSQVVESVYAREAKSSQQEEGIANT